MSTDLSTRSRRLFGLIGAGAMATAAIASYLGVQNGHRGSTYLLATFGHSAQGLDDQSDVKIRGINVGTVSSVALTAQGRVRVRIRLDPGIKAPSTTTAVIEPLSVFGPKVVNLRPGTGEGSGPYLADGATIGHTEDPQDLTDIATPTYKLLSAVDPQDVSKVLHTFSQGLDGRGQGLSNTIDNAAILLALSSENTQNLKALIENGTVISSMLAGRGEEVVRLARDLNLLSPAFAGDPVSFHLVLTGTSKFSDEVIQILRSDPAGPGRIINSIVPVVNVNYQGRANTPPLITGVGAFFAQTSGILQVDGPHGTLLGTETAHVNSSDPICTFILGLCRPYPQPLPEPKPKGH